MRRSLIVLVTSGLLALASQPALAQWKWLDKNGQVNLSDLPPPRGVPDRDVLARPSAQPLRYSPAAVPASAASSPSTAQNKPQVDPELEARRKRAEQEQATQRKQEEEKLDAARAENCERARAHLRSLDSGMRLSRVNESGEREILSDKERAEEAQRSRNVVASDCR